MPAAATSAKGKGRLSKEQLGQQLRAAALANEGGVGAGAVATSLLQLMSTANTCLTATVIPAINKCICPPCAPSAVHYCQAAQPRVPREYTPGLPSRSPLPSGIASKYGLPSPGTAQ